MVASARRHNAREDDAPDRRTPVNSTPRASLFTSLSCDGDSLTLSESDQSQNTSSVANFTESFNVHDDSGVDAAKKCEGAAAIEDDQDKENVDINNTSNSSTASNGNGATEEKRSSSIKEDKNKGYCILM